MPITNINDLLESFSSKQSLQPVKYGAANLSIAGFWNSSWLTSGSNLAPIPPFDSGEACNKSTIGAMLFDSPQIGKQLYLSKFMFAPNQACGAYLLDRLVHTSGLSGTSTATQNVDTVPLPSRAMNGNGTELWVEWYVSTGATSRNLTITYTNSDGVGGKTSTITIPAACKKTMTIRAPLAPGDKGVQSVQSVLLNGSTATAGNFGIVIAKRVSTIDNIVAFSMVQEGPIELQLPVIDENSCLYFITNSTTTISPSYDVELNFIEG